MNDDSTRPDTDTDDSLQPRKDEDEARWQEGAAGKSGQGGQGGGPVSGSLGPSGPGMGADTTEQPDPSRDRFRDLNQS